MSDPTPTPQEQSSSLPPATQPLQPQTAEKLASQELSVTREPGTPDREQEIRVVRVLDLKDTDVYVEFEARIYTKQGLQDTFTFPHKLHAALASSSAEVAKRQFKRYLDISSEDTMAAAEHFFLNRILDKIAFAAPATEDISDDADQTRGRGFFSPR